MRTPKRTRRGRAKRSRQRLSEYAARGGLKGKAFTWGDELAPEGRMFANFWQGEFPWQNLMSDGYAGTSPVAAFPANGPRPVRHGRQRLGVDM